MRRSSAVIAFVLLGGLVPFTRAAEADWFPFVIPWDDASQTVTDVSALNPTPAGGGGFLKIRDGHFYDGHDRRVRFLGVNFVFNANFPDKPDAEKVAARLHKYGINIVRLHHMDFYHAPRGIFDPAFKDRQHLDKDQLDRLDYLVHQLKRHGVYVNINLHVSRAFTEADGFRETEGLPSHGKAVDYYEPRMIELQKNYARDLLTHFNPYTRSRYVEEPGVAVIEINNENTLLGAAWDKTLDTLPPLYRAELARQWHAWLKQTYGDTAALRRAWSAADKPFGPNLFQNAGFADGTRRWTLETHEAARARMSVPDATPGPRGVAGKVLRIEVTALGSQTWHIQFQQAGLDLVQDEPYTVSFWARADRKRPLQVNATADQADWHNVGLSHSFEADADWRPFTFGFTPRRTVKDHSRLTLVLGGAAGTVDLAGLSLRPGVRNGPPENTSLEAGTLPLGHPVANPPGQDWIAFLIDTERRYHAAMQDYIKKDLGAHALVTCSQASYGGLGGALREARSDFTDMHAYWQHPEFPHKSWDAVDWRIRNTSMTRDPQGGTLPRLAQYRLAGKPFTVSEYNHPAPNDYQAECVPLLAACAGVQDWDGVYLFDYNGDRQTWKDDKIRNFFSVDTNPAKMALLPAAAMLFLRGDLPPANEEARLRVPEGKVAELLARNGQSISAEWEAAGSPRLDVLARRLSVSFVPDGPGLPALAPGSRQKEASGSGRGAGGLRWQPAGQEKPVFTAEAPSSQLMVGFLGGQEVDRAGWRVRMAETPRNFAALALSAVDGRPLEQSSSLLLTAVGGVENAGMRWNADRTSVGNHWGTGPVRAEGIPASIALRTRAVSATVYALDGTGKRLGKVESGLSGGLLSFTIGPTHKTLWYEVEARHKP